MSGTGWPWACAAFFHYAAPKSTSQVRLLFASPDSYLNPLLTICFSFSLPRSFSSAGTIFSELLSPSHIASARHIFIAAPQRPCSSQDIELSLLFPPSLLCWRSVHSQKHQQRARASACIETKKSRAAALFDPSTSTLINRSLGLAPYLGTEGTHRPAAASHTPTLQCERSGQSQQPANQVRHFTLAAQRRNFLKIHVLTYRRATWHSECSPIFSLLGRVT